MKTISIKFYKVIVTLSLIIMTNCLSAQYVNIPDANFASYLNSIIPSAMNGNQMDTTSPVVISLRNISVEDRGIADLTGIQYFTSLTTLDCGNTYSINDSNKLVALSLLPTTLDTLICGYNRLKTISALPTSLVYVSCGNNKLTALPVIPKGLKYLDCSGNSQLDSLPLLNSSLVILNCMNDGLSRLPALPDSLMSLECDYNELGSLPVLPKPLASIICSYNVLTGLPALPASLSYLCCFNNQISNLPVLDSALLTLICSNNLLTNLPTLPDSLQVLKCYQNQITALPTLPNSINYIDCSSNQLQGLPTLPNSLGTLICSTNLLVSIPPLNGMLGYLDCQSNQLTTLPVLPASLNTLYCGTNLLTALPTLDASLSLLDCSQNQITILPALPSSLASLSCETNSLLNLPALTASLQVLNCSNNQLSVGLPVLPGSLVSLTCVADSLTGLPTLPGSLGYLNCAFNNISDLPALPGALQTLWCQNNKIACFPVFPITLIDTNAIVIAGNPFHCLPDYVRAMDKATLSYPLCGVGNANGCPEADGIVGFAYKDMNANCKKDSGDQNLVNIALDIYNGNNWLGQTYTAINGVYDFPDSAGTYKVLVDTSNMPFEVQCTHPGADSLVTVTHIDTNINFSFTCKSGFDVGVQSVVTRGLVFPGTQHTLSVVAGDISQWYNLNCAKGDSGTVQIAIGGPVTYLGPAAGALAPLVTGNVFTYTIRDFGAINNTTAFGLLLNTDTTAKAGDSICVSILVTPFADNNPANNKYHYCYPVTNSHDPNEKTVYPFNTSKYYKDWFIYTIYFQNTGTASAENITLVDTLDPHLALKTFEIINYSHPNTLHLKGNVLNVDFAGINLPDSATSPKGSIGFIQYRIKAKRPLYVGDSIKNTGYIYFDFNAPIVTNTTRSTIVEVDPSSVNNIQSNVQIAVFPNPNNGLFTIQLSDANGKPLVEIYDMLGEKISTIKLNPATTQLDLSNNAPGVYLYRVITETGGLISEGKMVIQK